MKNNLITYESQENEINRILQDGIDKSLLYIRSLNMSNFNDFSQPSTDITNKERTKKYSRTTYSTKNRITFNKTSKNRNALNKRKTSLQQSSKSQSNLKSKSLDKTIKIKKKINTLDYLNEYNKKREELEKFKNELIQERIRQNKLQKEMNSKMKKEKEFNKIEEKDNMIEKNSEDLILKIQQSERIREEQTKVIERLLSEYNFMITKIRKNPNLEILNKYDELKLEADNLKKEGISINKQKKLKKKTKII